MTPSIYVVCIGSTYLLLEVCQLCNNTTIVLKNTKFRDIQEIGGGRGDRTLPPLLIDEMDLLLRPLPLSQKTNFGHCYIGSYSGMYRNRKSDNIVSLYVSKTARVRDSILKVM